MVDPKLAAVLAGVLSAPAKSITLESSATSLPKWDSLNHVRIMLQIEKTFHVKFSAKELLQFKTVQSLQDALKKKGVL